VIALGPAANWQGKQWPADAFASLAATLTAPDGLFAGARVAVLAAAGERDQAAPLLAALPAERVIDLVGRVDLLTAAACLGRTGFFIGNDSGLMHLAAAVGTPTLGLFGPSRDERYRPWGQRAAVVRTPESYEELMGGPDFDAANCGCLMTGLSVEAVIAAAAALKAKA
jgi:ADP-heptose:LPS heptosyltransferase